MQQTYEKKNHVLFALTLNAWYKYFATLSIVLIDLLDINFSNFLNSSIWHNMTVFVLMCNKSQTIIHIHVYINEIPGI